MAVICLRVIFLESDDYGSTAAKVSQRPSKILTWHVFEEAMEMLGVSVDDVAHDGSGSSRNANCIRRDVFVELEADIDHARQRVDQLRQQEALLTVQVRNLSMVKAELDEKVEMLVQRSAELLQMEEAKLDDRDATMMDSEKSLFDDVNSP